jgi:heat-inducible transcriptional repressor
MTDGNAFLKENERARTIFADIVERFMRDGEPVGSRTLSLEGKRSGKFDLSPASVRNVMQDLEDLGILEAPHTSAGRIPTDKGLRLFVDGILEVGDLTAAERAALEEECGSNYTSIDKVMERASSILSGLSQSAGLVVTPTQVSKPLKHIEFVSLDSHRAMVVTVSEDGSVENRPIDLPAGTTPDMLREAGSFLSQKLFNKTISQMRDAITEEIHERESEIGTLTKNIIAEGLNVKLSDGNLIVRGHSQLLQDPKALQHIDRLKMLMEQLESKETVSRLLAEAEEANGVKIYIGSENSVFEGTGHSLILSPYRSGQSNSIVGAIGVIGPTRLDYAKIIPSVNFMAEMLARRVQKLG